MRLRIGQMEMEYTTAHWAVIVIEFFLFLPKRSGRKAFYFHEELHN